ncbi:MAG: Photosystem I reaction center subunit III [Leptolyngbyaceae cyanobacterium MO_188.B28]|nr:Photosystem I reaction center subunit III [Leptolyngbyaceae cyanobacterium MO_188.B28]
MRRLFALVSGLFLWLGFTLPASADVAGLVPCGESAAFQARAANAINAQAAARFDFYGSSGVLCGTDGLPHLIVDGDLGHLGEFAIPSIMFLYIAGWIGWAGRSYLIASRKNKNPEQNEIFIDVGLAITCSLAGATWPLAAFGAFASGSMMESDDKITVSPR